MRGTGGPEAHPPGSGAPPRVRDGPGRARSPEEQAEAGVPELVRGGLVPRRVHVRHQRVVLQQHRVLDHAFGRP